MVASASKSQPLKLEQEDKAFKANNSVSKWKETAQTNKQTNKRELITGI